MFLLPVIVPWKKNKQIADTYLMPKSSSGIYFGKCFNGSFWLQFSLAADGKNKNGKKRGTLRSHFYSGKKFNLEQTWEGSINYFIYKDQ